MKKLKRKIQKLIVSLMGSPIKIEPNLRNRQVKTIDPLPKEVLWDTSIKIHKTKKGIEYVKTPEECFLDLPGYNFNENYFDINGLKMHYVDAGPSDGKILLLLHGQPVWSYLYRTMIHELVAKGYRCIAPDLMGMGKSDKPISIKYHVYDTHCDNILTFIKKLKLKKITLFCQDWGSLIGLRIAGENSNLFSGIIAANAELPNFTEESNPLYIPEPVKINTKIKSFKKAMAYHFLNNNGFNMNNFQAWVTYCITTPFVHISEIMGLSLSRDFKKDKKILDAYAAPFPSFIYMAGPRTLPSMNAGITGQTLKAIDGLKKFKKPFLSLIGLQDKLLGTPRIQNRWIKIVPGAKGQDHEQFKEANHFIQEDIGEIMADRMHKFILKIKFNEEKILKIVGLLSVLILLFFISLPTLLNKAGLHPEFDSKKYDFTNKKAVIISTSHSTLNKPGETTGKLTGVFASELTVPYYEFTDSGIEVDLASINGGTIPIDPESFFYVVKTSSDNRYLEDPILKEKVKNSIKIDELEIDNYDLVFIAGGWGAAYDLGYSKILGKKISQAYYNPNSIIGGVCHGVLGFINAKDSLGNLIIKNRRMTGVTDKQIKELGIDFTPQHPEKELIKAGVIFESKTALRDVFANLTVTDDESKFVTGQNQNAGHETPQKMMEILKNKQ